MGAGIYIMSNIKMGSNGGPRAGLSIHFAAEGQAPSLEQRWVVFSVVMVGSSLTMFPLKWQLALLRWHSS